MGETSTAKQPLSLKWKWGILLCASFITLSMVSLFGYFHHAKQVQLTAHEHRIAQMFESAVTYFETLEKPFTQQTLLGADSEEQAFNHFITYLEQEEVIVRLFNERNQLIYETKVTDIPVNSIPKESVKILEKEDDIRVAAQYSVVSPNLQHKLGNIQLIHESTTLNQLITEQKRLEWFVLMLIVVASIVLAILLTTYFLLPLNYLNRALSLVEEESLSEIRIRKPGSNDEWSDLNIHINGLLDKIDLYVRNQKQFVEDVSHELRTPVAIVEGHLKMLNRWGKDDPVILEESIVASLQEITRMKDLVQEMLDLSRADHVEADYKDEITEVYSTVQQVYNNFMILYPNFKFYLDSEKEGKELFVKMYRNHFEQILIILLDNAVKYSRDRHEIHLSVSKSFTKVEIAVQDFGEGMTEEDKERVFGRFYRVDKARSRDKGGNGLGLSIAKQLVSSYKGKIRVESVLNHGSIFYVEFPVITDHGEVEKYQQLALKKSV